MEFLSSIITGDKMLISDINVETNQQSMQCHHFSSPISKKFKQIQSQGKIVATVFWYQKGVCLIAFTESGMQHLSAELVKISDDTILYRRFEKLVLRYQKCLEKCWNFNYVQKQIIYVIFQTINKFAIFSTTLKETFIVISYTSLFTL